jgi:hypothetical protein
MRRVLIIVLIMACIFFLFEPLIEKYEETSASQPPVNCFMKYKRIFEERGEKNPDKLAKQLCNSDCINSDPTSLSCLKICESTNKNIYSSEARDSDCKEGYFKCHCCKKTPNGRSSCQYGTTKNAYDHTCGHRNDNGYWKEGCTGPSETTDNLIDIDENRPWNRGFPYPDAQ